MILYISCHSILEYDELQLFADLGHDCFSLGGAYTDPKGHYTLPRPGIPNLTFHEDLMVESREFARTSIPPGFLEKFSHVVIMHSPEIVTANWPTFKSYIANGGRVIWRSIGQSTESVENKLRQARQDGLEIIRYSPKETNIPGFLGADEMIRFYKDESVYKDWNGTDNRVVNFTQSLKGRRNFVHHDEIMHVIEHFNGKVYGTGNEDLGEYNGGELTYDQQNKVLKDVRCAVYGGTWPASYTLSFMEYLMTGTPIVAIDRYMATSAVSEHLDFYEVEDILLNCGGMVAHTKEEMIEMTNTLLTDFKYAKKLSDRQRTKALEIFSKERISKQWQAYLQ